MSGGISASTLATAAIGAQSFGAVYSGVGAYNASKQQQASYDYQAQVQRNNAQVGEWQAEDALKRGATAVQNQQLQTAQLKGTQRAGLAARGLDLSEGSPLDILTTTDYMGQRDVNTLQNNSDREAWALRQGVKGTLANAALLQSRSDSESPFASAAGTFLTGAGSVASSWYKMRQSLT